MNKLFKLGFFLAFMLLIEAATFGQGFAKKNKYWAIGGALNAMNYVGEVDPGPSFISPGIKFTKYNFGIDAQYRFHPRMFLRGTFSYGRIKGDDAENSKFQEAGGDVFRKLRNLSFRSQIYELKADLIIDFFEHRSKYQKRPDFVPYGFIGIAYFHHNPQAQIGGSGAWYNLRENSTEGQGVIDGAPKKYSLHQVALPVGLGLRYKLTKQLDLSFEIGWRFTTTDYLDDIGGKYPDKVQLYNAKGLTAVQLSDKTPEIYNQDEAYIAALATYAGPIVNYSEQPAPDYLLTSAGEFGAAGEQRGDKKGRRDAYIITGFHLTYIIPQKVICPKFR
ncbi:MAG: DUF6089 family protein [Cytophagaceae bacterium]|jgi:hypothetical protein|nr:DUF6089 family protein [Cytophagaceae bacterium]